jgi:hypothetical protein
VATKDTAKTTPIVARAERGDPIHLTSSAEQRNRRSPFGLESVVRTKLGSLQRDHGPNQANTVRWRCGEFEQDESLLAACPPSPGNVEKAIPGRRIAQIDIRKIAVGGGGIHCITQQQPA